jgi:predicted DNA-binding helix-hairpin-helix protein
MMDALDKLKSLSSQMHLEPAEDSGCPKVPAPKPGAGMIHNAALPGGKHIPLLKTLLTSACERNCYYCPFRAGRDYRRTTIKPDEMAQTFTNLHARGVVEGMFLSSGIVAGGVHTQDKLLATAEILRKKYYYRGYLHLKIMPGAEHAQVERAMQLADRVSVNLEAPNTERLLKLAPRKEFIEELLQPLRWVQEIRQTEDPRRGWNGRWPSSVTQFVAGGSGESDLELLSTTEFLYHQLGLRRAYFSAFNPIPDTPLEDQAPTSPQREHRLYQSSFLLQDYGFSLEDLPFDRSGNLPTKMDPKMAWAQLNLTASPVEVNSASRLELLRVPGFGPKSVNAILVARRQSPLRDLADLKCLNILTSRSAPFILLNGHKPSYQPSLF